LGLYNTFARAIPTQLGIAVLLTVAVPVLSTVVTQGVSAAANDVSGTVRDSAGAAVSEAEVTLLSPWQAVVAGTTTDANGRFGFAGVPNGSYVLIVRTRGFAERRQSIVVPMRTEHDIEVVLEPGPVSEKVTVTANPGVVESVETISQPVNVISPDQIDMRAKAVIAQAANEEVGVQLQRTSPTIGGVFIRGLTGNKVNVFIDGVRYSTSAMRGGINSFLDLIEPSSLQALEILRGPNSAQYGSDAIGGSLQFLTRAVPFSADGVESTGRMSASFNSADASFGSSLNTAFSTSSFTLLADLAGRRVNRLRTGGGIDSHNALTRFLGLSSDLVVDERLPDTAFTQYGGRLKAGWLPEIGHRVEASYMRSQQDGGKRYDQLLGGDGNLVADLRNFMLDFFYLKYDKIEAGWFDNFTLSYSFNSQREERVNQGGNGNPLASINHEYERTGVHGLHGFLSKQAWRRQNLVVGGEYYRERIASPSFGFNPVSNNVSSRRPRVPNNSLYRSGGLYLQDVFDAVTGTLRLVSNVRYSAASYRARAADSPLVNGKPLWPDDSLRVDDFTFRFGAVVTPVEGLALSANVSRGFRAPHTTDLGTLGLTGSGFEVAAPDVAGLGATVGSTAGGDAVSTGRPVTQVRPETSLSYELGVRYRHKRVDTDFAFFVNDIKDNIAKQALILPPGAVGIQLGGETINAQDSNGVVFVIASPSPVLVRTNFDNVRIYGVEHTLDLRITSDWAVGTVFTYIHAMDKRTKLPPNIEGGTPAPDGYLKIRYSPAGRRFWIEPYAHLAGRQDRLSSLDLEDRRTGAERSRGSIRNFFLNGAAFRGLVGPGADAIRGTADDVLLATGEILTQVQDRVLGAGVDSAPLFTGVPGFVVFGVRGGVTLGDRHQVTLDFDNIGDRNYRGISWGVDAPGRGIYMRYSTSF
jgi:outer membrane receptor protein involved in Fe transport